MSDRNVLDKYPGTTAAFFAFVFVLMVFIFSHFQEQIAHLSRLCLVFSGDISLPKEKGVGIEIIEWDPSDPKSKKKIIKRR